MTVRSVTATAAAAIVAAGACSMGSEATAPTTTTATVILGEGVGDLGALPTTTVPHIEVPAALPPDLESAGAEALVIVVPEKEQCTLVVTFQSSEIGFALDSAELPRAGREAIVLTALQLIGADAVSVVGHTSSEGDRSYNDELSRRRAEAVAAVLAPLLPDAAIGTAGVGSAEPIDGVDESTEEGRSRNRRVVISAEVEREECTTP